MNMQASTDDEVLALAERIKHQRILDGDYLRAFTKLDRLHQDTSTGGDKVLRECNSINIQFYTINADRHVQDCSVRLPVESGDDLIAFLLNHTEEKLP